MFNDILVMSGDIIRQTQEYRDWGWNALTISALGTAVFTLIEGWGLWKQSQAIWREKSGESVSVSLFSYVFFAMLAVGVYGVYVRAAAMIFTCAVIALVHVPILIGLWRYKGFTKFEKWQFVVCTFMVIAMCVLPEQKDEILLIVSVGVLYAFAMQPWELWRTKNSGVVEIRFIIAYFISTTFWLVYFIVIEVLVMVIVNVLFFVLMSLCTFLWFRYRTSPRIS